MIKTKDENIYSQLYLNYQKTTSTFSFQNLSAWVVVLMFFPNRLISILYFHWFQGIYSFFMLTTKLCWYWPIISLNRNTKVFLSQHNNLVCFISLCQGTAISGSINHMYERLYITESKLRVHLDSPLLKERRVFLEENANMGKSKDRLRILASYIFTLRMLCIYTTGKMI